MSKYNIEELEVVTNAVIDAGEYSLSEEDRQVIKDTQNIRPYWTDVAKAALNASNAVKELGKAQEIIKQQAHRVKVLQRRIINMKKGRHNGENT